MLTPRWRPPKTRAFDVVFSELRHVATAVHGISGELSNSHALQLWAQSLPEFEEAENSQREWSEVWFAMRMATPRPVPLAQFLFSFSPVQAGGYTRDLDVSAAQMEQERKAGQAKLLQLSANSKQVYLKCGHNMELEDPDRVASAIHQVVNAVQNKRTFRN